MLLGIHTNQNSKKMSIASMLLGIHTNKNGLKKKNNDNKLMTSYPGCVCNPQVSPRNRIKKIGDNKGFCTRRWRSRDKLAVRMIQDLQETPLDVSPDTRRWGNEVTSES